MTPLAQEWGRLVRERREAVGMTQRQLAAAAGLSQQGVSAIEKGLTNTASDPNRLALAQALGVPVEVLFPYPVVSVVSA